MSIEIKDILVGKLRAGDRLIYDKDHPKVPLGRVTAVERDGRDVAVTYTFRDTKLACVQHFRATQRVTIER